MCVLDTVAQRETPARSCCSGRNSLTLKRPESLGGGLVRQMQSLLSSGEVRNEGARHMQSYTGSVTSRSNPEGWELLSRLVRYFRGAAVAQRPAIRWGDMKPIDFQGEDTSLTQEQIGVMK